MQRPLADAVAAAALLRVEVDVVFVITVGIGAEHRRESRAGGSMQPSAQGHRHIPVGEVQRGSVREHEAAHVEGVAEAMLA